MDNIDSFMNRPGATYVYLRNAVRQYTDGWNFSSSDVKDDFMLEELFGDRDREIFLMCQSGTRGEYIKLALESIGYTSVYNVGGFPDYTGTSRVAGDPSFSL